jgi:signal transduction histidine kinase
VRVLIVDDRPENLDLLEQMLKARGYEVTKASHGKEALEKARSQSFDLLISDIMMPVMDGFQLCRQIKTDDRLKRIPFVFYTETYTGQQDETFALALGAEAFIIKPSEPQGFLEKLETMLRQPLTAKPSTGLLADGDEIGYVTEYNERLVRKLEDKVMELEVANRNLKNVSHTLEQRVTERTAQLAAANRELEAFAYSVAHDLRAPLRAIDAFGNILLHEHSAQLDDTGKDCARRITVAARQMDALIQDLLAYSSIGTAQIELAPVDLTVALRESQHQSAEQLREANARVEVLGPLPFVRAHDTILGQILNNLLQNAAKFVAAGVQPQIRVRAEERGPMVRVWMEDNGIGIAPEHHERVFRVFERLHGADRYPGTGIGLAIVKKAALRMQGDAGVESEVGKGSRFWIELATADQIKT